LLEFGGGVFFIPAGEGIGEVDRIYMRALGQVDNLVFGICHKAGPTGSGGCASGTGREQHSGCEDGYEDGKLFVFFHFYYQKIFN